MNPQLPKRTLDDSLAALALVAVRDTGADGFAYFRLTAGGMVLSQAFGAPIAEQALSGECRCAEAIVHYPLSLRGTTDGVLAFAFSSREKTDEMQPRLKRFVSVIEKVWAAQSLPEEYRDLLERISALEMELVDSKIASSARGVLQSGQTSNTLGEIAHHVESVLRPSPLIRTLDQVLHELEDEVEERKWTLQAKTILQNVHGMSEREAHARLRRMSRHSRRPLREVAKQFVIETPLAMDLSAQQNQRESRS